MPAQLDERLTRLHRDLYDALLRPIELVAREPRSFAACFWPDLMGSAVDSLLAAFTYQFVRRVPVEMSVVKGLAVLRAVFFNHEVDEPGIWLATARQRLASERTAVPERCFRFAAPGWTKAGDLAFTLVSERDRPAGGPGWIDGDMRRQPDGSCQVSATYGIGTLPPDRDFSDEHWGRLDHEAQMAIERVFGWHREEAA